jgi:hypothetical protein
MLIAKKNQIVKLLKLISHLLSMVFDDLSTKSRRASAHKNTIGLPILFL